MPYVIGMKPIQCRMARAALGYSIRDLAEKAGVGPDTVYRFENDARDPRLSTVTALRETLEAAGVVFIEADASGGPGVRLSRSDLLSQSNP